MGDNRPYMSQERSPRFFAGASLFLALLAYAAGLAAMALVQKAVAGKVEFRLILILAEIGLALPALVAGALLASRLPDLYRFTPLVPLGVLKTSALGLALWVLSLGVFEAQYVLVKPPLAYLEQFQGLHAMLKPVGLSGWIFSIAAIALAPAICEEILFRGLLTPVFRRAAGTAFAIVASAALFAAIHIDGVREGDAVTTVYYRLPFAFVLGMLLAKIRLDTGSLWPPIIAHATLNATTFVVVLMIEQPKPVLEDPRPLVALGMLAVGATAVRFLMRGIRPAPPVPSA